MTLQQLRYVVMVAETGNITDAADKLYISQPSLSAAVRAIEKEMNVVIFLRTNKGVTVTREGEEFLSYARQLLEQADMMEMKFAGAKGSNPRFSVSCQHYSFAVNAFVDLIQLFDSDSYSFTLRETQTHEIIEDVSLGKSEIGILYLSNKNEEVIQILLKKNNLVFQELIVAKPHIFISEKHPLAKQETITLKELESYPYLTFEQGEYNSFYYSEELVSSFDRKKNIMVRDRATLFNLVKGLDGYTVSSGVIDSELNSGIIARNLVLDDEMRIIVITKKNMEMSRYGKAYVEFLKKHVRKS